MIEDIIFLQDKCHKIKTSEDDMLKFYGLSTRYYQMKMDSANYEFKDAKFTYYFANIHNINIDFNGDV